MDFQEPSLRYPDNTPTVFTGAKRFVEAHGMEVWCELCGALRIVYVATEETDPKAGLKLLAQAKSAVGDSVTVDTRVLYTEAVYGVTGIVDALANGTREWGADLVVLGSSHRRALERWVIGSVAEQLSPKLMPLCSSFVRSNSHSSALPPLPISTPLIQKSLSSHAPSLSIDAQVTMQGVHRCTGPAPHGETYLLR